MPDTSSQEREKGMKTYKWNDVKRKKFTEKEIKKLDVEVEKRVRALRMKKLREFFDLSQEQLAKILNMKQPQISRLESREDIKISTIRNVVESLGGELQVIAKFKKKECNLMQIEDE